MATHPDETNSKEYNIQAQLSRVAQRPGVYLMKNAGHRVLYVGKAANLRKRLQSYFKKSGPVDPKTRALVRKITHF